MIIEKVLLHLDIDGHVASYTIDPITEGEENTIIVDNPTQDLIENYLHYKIVDGALVRMLDDEYNTLHPVIPLEPTESELLGQRITDQELDAMESNQRITDLELLLLEGGI